MLASYASNHKNSGGRLYQEADSKNRTSFQRDRDRIIHSFSFRRLEYKTQVFMNYESDHFRTRLTHSLEVAQIARTIARKLKLDQDLAEASALAHDIGHPPFGHAGEQALNELMKKYGGFDHNAQALKILTKLEAPYAAFDGLNLTRETLASIIKHNGPIKGFKTPKIITAYNKIHNLELKKYPSLEAQIAAISDDIAYNNHDIDDGIRAKLLQEKDLMQVKMIAESFAEIDQKYPQLETNKRIYEVRRIIYSKMVDDVIATTEANLKKYQIKSLTEIKNARKPLCQFSTEMGSQVIELKQILRKKLYTHPEVYLMNRKAYRLIIELFEYFMANHGSIPLEIKARFDQKKQQKDQARVICDYISGMTDRYAIEQHRKFFDLYSYNTKSSL
ncbi:MAG: deoxyguanosinetriphosphate triphosphohydrolase [Rickettsiales bacterium]